MATTKKKLASEEAKELLALLKARFEKNTNRHKGLEWSKVQANLDASPAKLWSRSSIAFRATFISLAA